MATNANYKNESVQIGVQLEKADFAIIENVLYRVAQDGSREALCEDARLPGTKFYYGASHAKLIGKFYKACLLYTSFWERSSWARFWSRSLRRSSTQRTWLP